MFEDLADCSDSQITDARAQLVGGMAATHRVVLELVRHCQERRVWKDDGMPSMAGWLSARFGLRHTNASEWVRVANALGDLPWPATEGNVGARRASPSAGVASLDNGSPLSAEVLRHLVCDARLELVVHGPSGVPIGVGRARRTVPPWMLRLLRRRDGGCRWPGCGRRRWLKARHLVHWADGGPTDLDNLALVCTHHHHLLHELGWTVSGDPNAGPCFLRPDGGPLNTGPPRLRPEVRGQLAGAIRAPLALAS
jgi:hypothetical protein